MSNVNVLPFWKDRSVRELTRRDVRALVTPIVDRGSPIMANRVLAVVRRMLNYGIRSDWLEANPASLIDKPGREVSRERVLTEAAHLRGAESRRRRRTGHACLRSLQLRCGEAQGAGDLAAHAAIDYRTGRA